MAASDRPRPSGQPKASECAVLEPPASPPPALSAESAAPGGAPILLVIHSRDARLLGRRYALDRSSTLIGSGVDNDIVLKDSGVSPRHAHLEERDGAWWCVDDGSTDGLYIDDRRTTGCTLLAHGTRIGIGSTIFKFLSGLGLEDRYKEEIHRLTMYDGLTQACHERYLLEALDKETTRARRHSTALALLMIEIDELGAIGGATEMPNAQQVASSPLAVGPRAMQATVCVGTAQRHAEDQDSTDVLERARRMLHVAQSRGRNQVECKTIDQGPKSEPGASA
jgi:pSer/pThr/pTyr-binding forkhead associated (FHA) protein